MEEVENLSLLDSHSASMDTDAENASLIKNRRHASSYERFVVVKIPKLSLSGEGIAKLRQSGTAAGNRE